MLNLIKGESSVEDVKKVLLTKSKRSKMEQRGKFISFLCIALIVLVVLSIFYFVASKGLATFLLIRSMYLIFCLVQIGIQAK